MRPPPFLLATRRRAHQPNGPLLSTPIQWKKNPNRTSITNSTIAIMNMKTMTTLVEPISSWRVVQFTFFISLSVAMRKSTLVGLFMIQKANTLYAARNASDDATTTLVLVPMDQASG